MDDEIMTTAEALQYAVNSGTRITYTGMVQAAQRGYIPGARRFGRDWIIPRAGLIYYLTHRPKPGRKPKINP